MKLNQYNLLGGLYDNMLCVFLNSVQPVEEFAWIILQSFWPFMGRRFKFYLHFPFGVMQCPLAPYGTLAHNHKHFPLHFSINISALVHRIGLIKIEFDNSEYSQSFNNIVSLATNIWLINLCAASIYFLYQYPSQL